MSPPNRNVDSSPCEKDLTTNYLTKLAPMAFDRKRKTIDRLDSLNIREHQVKSEERTSFHKTRTNTIEENVGGSLYSNTIETNQLTDRVDLNTEQNT